MPTPVAIKVSSEFAESARAAAAAADRSLTGQVEHWAKIGRATESILPAQVAAALKACAGDLHAIEDPAMRRSVLEALDVFRTKSPDDIRKLIGLDKTPAFEPDPAHPNGIIQVMPDGTRTRGVIKGRTFIPATS